MSKRVLLLDWGIGGLSVYNELKRLRPDISCVYISDSGSTPYGKMPAAELAARVAAVIREATSKFPVSHTIIACNAASTVLAEVKSALKAPDILGVIEAGIELVRECGKKKVGVIGGRRTIDSRIFSTALENEPIEVREQVAQPLSALIEAGVLQGTRLEAELRPILSQLENCDALLLACTHYPAIAAEIQKLLPRTLLLDPAARAARQLVERVPAATARDTDLFFTTGDIHSTETAARAAFHCPGKFTRWEMPHAE